MDGLDRNACETDIRGAVAAGLPGVASNERDVDVSKLSASSFSFAGLVARGVCMPSLMTKEVSEADRCCCGCCCICC